ncbi:hypothetical protein [Companilactobacillus halodurans]|uniref:Uncharacterized protein n=1 Tax=Companilactobacillus halodurans TaxID=2584183 RepID=A0A5P0ZPT3_9LACO|nr:hypothetical protein [Companilactobacillus halodurans]MQS76264.1 hypothetical protein [Companilactobacillus halodurans]MQS96608.1 hypothetical protein [Companilactobacillus halodurans]
MLRALKKTTRFFVYEVIVLGVIYDAMIVFQVMTKNISGMAVLIGLLALYLIQFFYFYHQK